MVQKIGMDNNNNNVTVKEYHNMYLIPLLHKLGYVLIFSPFRGYHILPNGGGAMKKLGGSQNFFMRNRGVTKKSRDYWVATNFNENFVQ